MDTECSKICVEALAIMGFDYRTIQLLTLEKPRHLIIQEEEEAVDLWMAVEGDYPEPADEKTAANISGERENDSAADGNDHPVLIDFEKICLWDHDGDLKVGIRMKDPDYMKIRLLEWVHTVAAYVRFLHSSADIT